MLSDSALAESLLVEWIGVSVERLGQLQGRRHSADRGGAVRVLAAQMPAGRRVQLAQTADRAAVTIVKWRVYAGDRADAAHRVPRETGAHDGAVLA